VTLGVASFHQTELASAFERIATDQPDFRNVMDQSDSMPLFDRIRLAALERRHAWGLSEEEVAERLDAVWDVFSPEWITARQLPSYDKFGETQRSHPFGILLHPLGDQQLAGLLELGTYLAHFAATDNMTDVHSALRGGDVGAYSHAILQLAFGLRFALGSGEEVLVEPEAKEGRKSDLSFELEGVPYIAECYRPDIRSPITAEVHLLEAQAIRGLKDLHFPVTLEIRLEHLPNAEARKALVNTGLRLARAIQARAHSGLLSHDWSVEYALGAGLVAARAGEGPKTLPIGDRGARLVDIGYPRSDPPALYGASTFVMMEASESGGKQVKRKSVHSVSVWLPGPPDGTEDKKRRLTSTIEKICDSLERKLPQTRTHDERFRILVVEHDIATQVRAANDPQLSQFRKRLLHQHEGVAGVFLVSREWHQANKSWGYRVIPVTDQRTSLLPRSFLKRMAGLNYLIAAADT
jgi:hypothetical protein